MKKVFGLLIVALAVSVGPKAQASDVTMDLFFYPPTTCSLPGSTVFLHTEWTVTVNGALFTMTDVLPLNPIIGSPGQILWHCTGNYTAGIFWKDQSLGICMGTAQAHLTAVASCNSGGYCTPKDPGAPFDYTIHFNNPACGP